MCNHTWVMEGGRTSVQNMSLHNAAKQCMFVKVVEHMIMGTKTDPLIKNVSLNAKRISQKKSQMDGWMNIFI